MDNLIDSNGRTLGRLRLRAMLSGVAGGTIAAIVGAVAIRWAIPGYLVDTLAWALGILVAPIAAAVSASVMRTTPGRTVASVGLALLVTFGAANLLDYCFAAWLFVSGVPGPFQGRTEWTGLEVDRVAQTWVLARHVIAITIGVFGGAAVGVWLGRSQARREPAEGHTRS